MVSAANRHEGALDGAKAIAQGQAGHVVAVEHDRTEVEVFGPGGTAAIDCSGPAPAEAAIAARAPLSQIVTTGRSVGTSTPALAAISTTGPWATASGACDAVVLATPLLDHARQSVSALDAGLHVLSEVIAATTPDEATALIEAGKLAASARLCDSPIASITYGELSF